METAEGKEGYRPWETEPETTGETKWSGEAEGGKKEKKVSQKTEI